MNKINNGGPAFPFEYHNQTSKDQDGFFNTGVLSPGASQQFAGMTLRDYFAAKALQGFAASTARNNPTTDQIAQAAYALADAMLRAREVNK